MSVISRSSLITCISESHGYVHVISSTKKVESPKNNIVQEGKQLPTVSHHQCLLSQILKLDTVAKFFGLYVKQSLEGNLSMAQ